MSLALGERLIPLLQQREGAVPALAGERHDRGDVALVELGVGGDAEQAEAAAHLVLQQLQRAQIIVDGGFLRGTDIVKAMALGAAAVGIGRLCGLGLAAAGVPGLVRTLELLEDEVRIALGLLGATSYAELTPQHLSPAAPAGEPGVFSAFPHLKDE